MASVSAINNQWFMISTATPSRRRRRLVGNPQHTITRLPLGQVHYSTVKYLILQPDDAEETTKADDSCTQKFEFETKANFLPALWLVKVGMSRAFELLWTKSGSRNWQRNLRTFNLVSSPSLIFDFCRSGNLDAVQHLLAKGEASVDDINEYGETPLHIAAGRYHVDVCALLLQEGANTKACQTVVFRGTPFSRVFSPADVITRTFRVAQRLTPVSHQRLELTIREFLKNGEDFENFSDKYKKDLKFLLSFEAEGHVLNPGPMATSIWLLNEVIPATNPWILDRGCWRLCLRSAVTMRTVHRSVAAIMEHCDVNTIRAVLLDFIHNLNTDQMCESSFGDIQLLIDSAGGLNFVVEYMGTMESPVSMAIRSPRSFTKLRALLKAQSYTLKDVVEQEVQLHSNGWTVKTLLALFNDKYDYNFQGYFMRFMPDVRKCKKCDGRLDDPLDCPNIPWKRKIRRYKEGLEQDDPLNDEEAKEAEAKDLKLLKEAVEAYKKEICWHCLGTRVDVLYPDWFP